VSNLDGSGDSWDQAGDELRELDPPLYAEMLELAKAAIRSHRDPLGLRRAGPRLISLHRSRSRGSA
jgi:hypothetical protein